MVLMFMVMYICKRFHENVQRAITLKVDKSELRFMCSALCLMVLYICVQFCENITNSIRVIEQTPVCLFVLRFYGPVNPMGSCRAWLVYLATCLLGRLSPLSS